MRVRRAFPRHVAPIASLALMVILGGLLVLVEACSSDGEPGYSDGSTDTESTSSTTTIPPTFAIPPVETVSQLVGEEMVELGFIGNAKESRFGTLKVQEREPGFEPLGFDVAEYHHPKAMTARYSVYEFADSALADEAWSAGSASSAYKSDRANGWNVEYLSPDMRTMAGEKVLTWKAVVHDDRGFRTSDLDEVWVRRDKAILVVQVYRPVVDPDVSTEDMVALALL